MKRILRRKTWTWSLTALSCVGLLMGQLPAWAFGPSPEANKPASGTQPATSISDVALDETGHFSGQVVDDQGQSRGGIVVVLRQGHREVARTQTDSRGHFAMANIPAGLYQVDVGSTRSVYRIWTNESAPPGSRQQVVLVSSPEQIVRGNHIEGTIDQLDAITLALVSTSIASLVVAGITLDKVDDLERQLDDLEIQPRSP
uniref:Carboxypeptidase regulatory-like domain-containing protein n=1 Tax=uncultured Planctomycetota bacterium TaxID=120965 RepID=A0A1B0Z231_9BACT|nr:hypothetical protein [uncultured Planctomycetota bacterium]